MKASFWLQFGIATLLALALVAWVGEGFTHLRGYSQGWVDSAPTATIREERAQGRAKAIKKVAEMKQEQDGYALAFLGGAVALSIVSYGLGKRRSVQHSDLQPRRGD